MNNNQANMLSFILGNQNVLSVNNQQQPIERLNRKLIINSAMFWDSKKRVQKIKTLFMNSMGLKEFDDVQDFKVQELDSIQLLSLSKNQIIHLHPISQLTTILSLNVSFNKVYDLNPLAKLEKLEQLYATNNQIKTIQPIISLFNLKILQVYNNKIHNFKETFQTLENLRQLNELDIDENPVARDIQFIELIANSFGNLKKLNGELNRTPLKIKQMSSSKGFANTISKGFMSKTLTKGFTTSTLFNGSVLSDNMIEKTFYNFCKKKASSSELWEKRQQKQKVLKKLQIHYMELDEQFQKEIVKNVQLKNRLYKIIEDKKKMEKQNQDRLAKNEEIQQLKRKVKALKEQLFTKDKKGELLRKLFQIQLSSQESETPSPKQIDIPQAQKLKQMRNQIKWTRKFQADDVIIIQNNDQFLQDDIEQINNLIGNIDHQILELKRDLDYLS